MVENQVIQSVIIFAALSFFGALRYEIDEIERDPSRLAEATFAAVIRLKNATIYAGLLTLFLLAEGVAICRFDFDQLLASSLFCSVIEVFAVAALGIGAAAVLGDILKWSMVKMNYARDN